MVVGIAVEVDPTSGRDLTCDSGKSAAGRYTALVARRGCLSDEPAMTSQRLPTRPPQPVVSVRRRRVFPAIGPRRRAFAQVVTAGVLCAACACAPSEHLADDLSSRLETARRQPGASSFLLTRDAASSGRAGIEAAVPTRLTFHVTVPRRARFSTSVVVGPASVPKPGAPVTFLIGVSDGRVFRQLRTVELRTAGRIDDISVDLREYEFMTIDLVLNLRAASAPDGAAPRPAAWIEPRILAR